MSGVDVAPIDEGLQDLFKGLGRTERQGDQNYVSITNEYGR